MFININSTDWGARGGFGQNRAFMGLGFFLDTKKHYRFELGYINQLIGKGKEVNHLISGSFMIRY